MIIHKTNKAGNYICNHACGRYPTLEKCSYRWYKVTCKNCLKQRPKKWNLPKNKGFAMVPVHIDPLLVEQTRKITPLYGLIATNNGNKLEFKHPWYKNLYRYIKKQVRMFLK